MRTRRLAGILRRRRAVLLPTLSVLALLALPGTVLARDGRTIFLMDRCDPDSFNAAIGPGTCVRDGGVTFDKFLRRVNPNDGGHNAWRFSRHDVDLKPGERLTVTNTGGETHSFTEVVDFGTGIEEALKTIESELPRPQVEFDVLLPYERGDLVNRIHQEAEIGSMEHTGDGTLVVGRANADLAGELEAYAR